MAFHLSPYLLTLLYWHTYQHENKVTSTEPRVCTGREVKREESN